MPIVNNDVYEDWASGEYPFDFAEKCNACLSEHESPLRCSRRDHEPLRKAAREAELVKLVGKLAKTNYAPYMEKIRKTFMGLRRKYKQFWPKSASRTSM